MKRKVKDGLTFAIPLLLQRFQKLLDRLVSFHSSELSSFLGIQNLFTDSFLIQLERLLEMEEDLGRFRDTFRSAQNYRLDQVVPRSELTIG